ncbi:MULTISPECIES: hypothetical protein [Duncaniella]|uniref:hypothetical protein n=2 Tax=Muribaculaceae TaxID=2005473 RepID=UPI001370E22D|nr:MULTISPECIES: hypothetical protein [Duncaniella]NCE69014.1 hypothetical protein [Muribaculaceae bacterium M3]
MKSVVISVFACMLAVLSSCEGRSGYLDEGQQTTVTMLTDVEWLMSYADYGYGSVETYDDETRIYKFDKTGKGWFASGSFTDISKKDDVSYYQWTFTTENFVVIYMTGHSVEGYWYIEKLTPNELWVQWTQQDPVLHPNQDKDIYKFKARKVIKQ